MSAHHLRARRCVLHRDGDRDVSVEEERWIAEQIPGAKFVELPGDDHLPWLGDTGRAARRGRGVPDRRARRAASPTGCSPPSSSPTSSARPSEAAALGDRRWRDLLEQHHARSRRELDRFGGREIDTTGDGFLATFDGPARAVRCALRHHATPSRTSDSRSAPGSTPASVELTAASVGGIAVHIGAAWRR